jgi:hypothetical protein
MAEKRAAAEAGPPPTRNTPPPPKNDSGGGGFNTNMLQRAQLSKQVESDSNESDDDWSDDGEDKSAVVAKKVQDALKPPPKPVNSSLKAPVSDFYCMHVM